MLLVYTALLPDLVLGEPTHGVAAAQTELVVREEKAAIDATVTVSLTTQSATWVETEVPVALPVGGEVYALAVQHGNQSFLGRSEPVELARAHFSAVHSLPLDLATGRPKDPALLEQTDAGLVLHVFPVVHAEPTIVRLYVRWPRPDAAVREDWMTVDPTPHNPVGPMIALYAGPIVEPPRESPTPMVVAHRRREHVAQVPEANLAFLDRPRYSSSSSSPNSTLVRSSTASNGSAWIVSLGPALVTQR